MIFCLVFMDLLQFYNLIDVEEIIFVGSSVGGIGILNYVDWVLKYVVEIYCLNVSFLFLIDLVWFIDFQGSFQGRVNFKFILFVNILLFVCLDYLCGYICCLLVLCMIVCGYYFVRVLLFLILSMYDIYMFGEVVKILEVEGKMVNEYFVDFIFVINMYGGVMNEFLLLLEEQLLNVVFLYQYVFNIFILLF